MEQDQKDEILNLAAQDLTESPPEDELTEQIIHGLAQSELTGRVRNASETYNLAQDMDSELLREIGEEVWKGFHDDDQTCQDWREMHTFWLSLYMQQDYAENSDPERSWGATESVPILTEACDQFQSRTYKIFFPNDTFVSAVPMRRTAVNRKELEDRAERIGRHMSYQLGFQDRSYKQDKDALFLGTAVHGSFFTKTYFSEKKKRFQVDNVRPTDLVVNYTVGPSRIEDLRRKTHILYTTIGETENLARTGFLIEPAKASTAQIVDNIYNIKVNETQGFSPTNAGLKQDQPAVLLEQHLYLDLDETGISLPYIATIDASSHKVLRLTIGYEADPKGAPLKDYEQVQYFTHYKYKENPDGFYGLGLGHTIGDLNSAVNIMLRQSMDAATLANDGNMSGFVSERLGLEGDEIRMVLGRFRKIPDTVGDLTNSLWTGKFPGPNAALLQIMQELDLRAQRLGATTEATTGSTEKVVQPTTLLNQIEQALEQFSSSQMRLANSFSEELQKIYRINQKYLPLVEYFVVNNEPEAITRADYADDMLIQPVFDPKYATQSQKMARAQAELQVTLQNPVNQARPDVIDAACKRVFEAMQVENIEELIPPQPQIENFDDQYIENMFFLMPKEARPLFDVFPDQNHLEHLAKMEEFFADVQTTGVQLQPDQLEDLLKHQQKHQGYLYGQLKGVVPTGQVSTPPLEARSDNPVDNGAAIAAIPPAQASGLADLLGVGTFGNGTSTGNSGNQPPV
jgi:chaperonin GroES